MNCFLGGVYEDEKPFMILWDYGQPKMPVDLAHHISFVLTPFHQAVAQGKGATVPQMLSVASIIAKLMV